MIKRLTTNSASVAFCGGSINLRILTPQKATEAEFVVSV